MLVETKPVSFADLVRISGLSHGTDVWTKKAQDLVNNGVAKLPDLSSFAGSVATTDRCLKVLCRDYGISVADASKMLSLAPAKLHKIDNDYGSIEVGKVADLVVTDREFNIKNVILNGNIVI